MYFIQEVSTDLQNLKKLIAGRIDVFPTSFLVAHTLMRNELNAKERSLITFNPKPLLQAKSFLLFSKAHSDSPRLLQVFNTGMKKIINQGKYDKLYNDLLDGKYESKSQ